jgi:ABC-type antimicrobial peptide transport system permease subunit
MAVVLDFHDGMIRFFFLIIGITILMTIMTPVRMLWQERFKELRMMAVLGFTSSKFWKIGFFEVVLMIALSAVFSTVLLVSIIGTQRITGVDFRNLGDGVSIERAGIKLPGIIYPLLTADQIIITFIFVVFVLGTSYLWSIHRTLQKLESEI